MSEELTFLNKTPDEIRTEIYKIASEETGLKNLKPTGVFRGILEVFSRVVTALYSSALNTIYNRANLDKAIGFWLDLWGMMLGVLRLEPVKTKGFITIKAYKSGKISKGAWVRVSSTDLRFKVLNETKFYAGETQCLVEAEFFGTMFNLSAYTPMSFKKVIAGIEEVFIGNDWIDTTGLDAEDDKGYKGRIKTKWASQGEGNPKSKYEQLIKKIDGVKEVKIIRTPRGFGSIDIYISTVTGSESVTAKKEAERVLDTTGLMCRDLVVRWPKPLKVDYKIEFSGEYSVEEIDIALKGYLLDIPMGKLLEVRKLYEWFDKEFPLLNRFEVVSPVRDVIPTNTPIIERILPPVSEDSSGCILQVVKR